MTAVAAERPRLGWPTMVLYGSGAMANTVKAGGLTTFLMIFYNQALGLDAHLVGLAMTLALIFDAFVDPAVGQVSDNTRSRWGRRHPYMSAAALPVAIAFYLLWNPPAGFESLLLFSYMMACLLTIRLFDTFFELPSSALLPELTEDYDKRTTIIAVRSLFGRVGALGMTLLAYQVFMREDPGGGGGVTERAGYVNYSITCGVVIFTAIIISTVATHRFIPWLRKAPPRKISIGQQAREIVQTLQNHAFVVATISGMFTAMAVACTAGLALYFGLFFWGFNQNQLSVITLTQAVAAIVGVSATPFLARAVGKKRGAIIAYTVGLTVGVAPILARLVDIMPANGTTLLFAIIVVETFVNGVFAVMTGVLLASMIADVVEDSEVKTGRRSEGLLFSADNLF
jgi:Na+/melibiose symporter-like transporter